MYLKEDITGAATGIVYGRKGDKVTILSESVELYFCELNGQKFYGRKEKFTEEKVNPDPKVIKESGGHRKQVGARTRRR